MNKQQIFKRISIVTGLLILVVAACGARAGETFDTASSGEMRFSTAPQAMEAEMVFVDDAMDMDMRVAGGDGGGFAEEQMARNQERIVIKNGDLSIAVEDPQTSMDEIAKMAEEMGGFVTNSNLYQAHLESGLKVPQGNITIRVPSDKFLEVLEIIEGSANQVISRNQSGQDVTSQYTDLNSRLVNLENTEIQLREIMASATKTEDVLRVYNELSRIRGEIEMVKGQIKYYEESSSFSSINVTLVADEAVQPLTIGGWQPGGVAKDAIQSLINTLQFLADFVIRLALLYLPVLLVIGIPLWLIWRVVKPRLNQPVKKVEPKNTKK